MSEFETTGGIFKERFAKRKTDYSLDPPFPDNCMVELTNACNHECVFCANPRMTRKVNRLPLDVFTRFIKEAVGLGVKEVGFYTTGDPMMTPNLHEFVQAATDAGAAYTYITTNGALATPERFLKLIAAGLKSVKFSINAASRESYKLVHGADDFDKVLAIVKWLSEHRKANKIDLRLLGSCVLTRASENERALHQVIFGPYLDDIIYVTAGGQAGQSIEEAQLVTPSDKKIEYPPVGSLEPCFMLWKRVHLTSEGYLTLCCVDYENNLTYANVDDGKPLMEHWHNTLMTEMRRKQINQELQGTLCHKCFYGGKDDYAPISDLGRESTGQDASARKAKWLSQRIDAIAKPKP